MNKMTCLRSVATCCALFAMLCGSVAAGKNSDVKPLVVFLVRHAEKADSGRDPELSKAGKARAMTLLDTLRSAKLDQIHSTKYQRTMLTAEPVAKSTKLQIQEYDPRQLPAFASSLRKSGGRHLVVGHSNTTPALVKLLGGEPGESIDEKAEFDRLYIVSIGSAGHVSSILMRYGKPFSDDK